MRGPWAPSSAACWHATADVVLVDRNAEHGGDQRGGLTIETADGDITVVPATAAPAGGAPFDAALVTVDANNTEAAAETAAEIPTPGPERR